MMNAQKLEISQKNISKPIVTKKFVSQINVNKPIVQKKILSFNGPPTSCTNEGKRFYPQFFLLLIYHVLSPITSYLI